MIESRALTQEEIAYCEANPAAPFPGDAELGRVASLAEAEDTAQAFDQLEAWIARNPAGRSCWAIDKLKGKWRVGLMCDADRFSASQDQTLRGAIRNALMIAAMAGCP